MIPAYCKFPLRTEFVAFKKRSRRLVFPLFIIHYLSSRRQSRCGVIVPKKLSKTATTRNWLKRLTYNTLWPTLKDKKLDTVIIYKPLALKKSMSTKQQIIHELLQVTPNL